MIQVIKIKVNNINYINQKHKEYIDKNVENMLNLYLKYKSFFSDELVEFLKIMKNDLDKLTLEELDLNLIEYIDSIYKKIKNKYLKDHVHYQNINNIVNSVDNYKKNLNSKMSREDRKKTLEKLIKNSKNTYDLTKVICIGDIKFSNIRIIKEHINNNTKDLYKLHKKINSLLKENNTFLSKEPNTIDVFIRDLFNYDNFCKNNDEWCRNKLLYYMDVKVCPYCNKHYIENYIQSSNQKKSSAELDHYYPKSLYPYLALSIYNFIPSCSFCNGILKKNKDFFKQEHLYPIKEGFDDNAHFIIDYFNKNSNIDTLLGKNNNFNINIEINTSDEAQKIKIENSKETFQLKDRYSEEKEFVSNITKKIIVYNEFELKRVSYTIDGLFDKEEDIKEVLFGFNLNKNNLDKKPLSKLTLDLFEEYYIEE